MGPSGTWGLGNRLVLPNDKSAPSINHAQKKYANPSVNWLMPIQVKKRKYRPDISASQYIGQSLVSMFCRRLTPRGPVLCIC